MHVSQDRQTDEMEIPTYASTSVDDRGIGDDVRGNVVHILHLLQHGHSLVLVALYIDCDFGVSVCVFV